MSNEYKDWLNDLKNAPKGSREYNQYLGINYPYLIPRDIFGTIDDIFDYTILDLVPEGWKELFIKMCDEINNVLDKYNICDTSEFYFYDVKEKWGRLNVEAVNIPKSIYWEVMDVMDKYYRESARVCIKCGKPAKYYTQGWVNYFCEEHTPSTKYEIKGVFDTKENNGDV
jgi:hypothetical protein